MIKNKVRYTIFILLVSSVSTLFGQIDPCKYFYLQVDEKIVDGRVSTSIYPQIKSLANDEVSGFMQRHKNRFSFLLWNKLDDLGEVADLYPDTVKLDSVFCAKIKSHPKFTHYVNNLLPGKFRQNAGLRDTFSFSEMMLVASRFFYCESISEDTLIQKRICVGISGQMDLPAEKDYSVLQAFVFEAIFHYLMAGNSEFENTFDEAAERSLLQGRAAGLSLDGLLEFVRRECYDAMSRDNDLGEKLYTYYLENRDNLNFGISSKY